MENTYYHIRKISLLCSCFAFIITMLILVGCSISTSSTLSKISGTMIRLESLIKEIPMIKKEDLIVSDFMNDTSLKEDYEFVALEDSPLKSYFNNITKLNNAIISTIEVNELVLNSRDNLISKSNQIRLICQDLQNNKKEFAQNENISLDKINTSISCDINRIKLTKNEVINNFISIETQKSNFSYVSPTLLNRYNTLKSSLNTRLTYFSNIESQLDSVLIILDENYDLLAKKTSSDDNTLKEKKNFDLKNNNQLSIKNEKKGRLKKNIDTYENANIKNDSEINNEHYFPIENENMPYYGVYGGYGGYGYGMPYGYGFRFPNINTYRGIRNIDTYKNRKKSYKKNLEIHESESSKNDNDNTWK